MTKTELETWAREIFWPRYKGLMSVPFKTQWVGGDRGKATTAIIKLSPSEALRNEILAAVEAQGRHRVALYTRLKESRSEYEKAKGLIYCNREGSTWINNKGWLTEIPALSELVITNSEGHTCIWCTNPVPHKGLLCLACDKKYKARTRKEVADWLEANGLFKYGDDLQTLNARCKEHLLNNQLFRKLFPSLANYERSKK